MNKKSSSKGSTPATEQAATPSRATNPRALQDINPHPRDLAISFYEPTHTYTIDGDTSFKSVTTWIHSFFPHFDPETVISKMRASKNWASSNKYYGKTPEEIKKEWLDNGSEASASGTVMHAHIEAYYNALAKTPMLALEPPEFATSKEGQLFQEYLNDHKNMVAYRTEWCVFAKKYKLAGSIDIVYRDPNDPTKHIIADWKRTKEIKLDNKWEKGYEPLKHVDNCNYWHYTLQLNVYRMILEKYYGLSISSMYLVILHPSQDHYQKIPINKVTSEIIDMLDSRKVELAKHEQLVSGGEH